MQTTARVKKHGFQRENMYDLTEHWRWLFAAMGHSSSRSRLYFLYKVAILVFLVYATVQSLNAVTKLTDKKDVLADALHALLTSVYALLGILIAYASYGDLLASQQTLLSGFYQYQGEELDTEGQKIVDEALPKVRRSVKIANMVPFIAFWNSFLAGILAIFCMPDEEYESIVDYCNPLLPHCIYMPFSTRSRLGFIGGYIITAWMSVFIYGLAVVHLQIFVSLAVQMSIQLEMLNHSIRTLPERADRMYAQYFGKSQSGERPFDQPEYQACLYKCLRSNIQHHQALKKFKNKIHGYTGGLLFLLLVSGAISCGSKLYLILKGPAFDKLIPIATTFLMEQTFAFFICYHGENILHKSGMLFTSLYNSQFLDCNKSFNKAVNIFMAYTREPLAVKMLIFDIKACIEFYGDTMAAAYKISNLLKQSDSKLNM